MKRALILTTGPEDVDVWAERGALFVYVMTTDPVDKKRKTPDRHFVVTENVTGQTLRVVTFRRASNATAFLKNYGKSILVASALAENMRGETNGPAMRELHAIVGRLRDHENQSLRGKS